MSAAWSVHDDGEQEPTLWYGDTAVLRFHDLVTLRWRVGTPQEQAERDDRLYQIWSVLTRVLAPDEATIIHLARALWQDTSNPTPTPVPDDYCDAARYVLAALTGTAAQDAEVSTDG